MNPYEQHAGLSAAEIQKMVDALKAYDNDADKVVFLGRDFVHDDAYGLWLKPSPFEGDCTAATYTKAKPAKDGPPEGASHLWENPEVQTTEIIGYRAWDYGCVVQPDSTVEILLQSPYQGTLWEGPVLTADREPGVGHGCGLYAIGTKERSETNYYDYVEPAKIWGKVAMSGIVVEGARGYRAERMAIQELFVNPDYMDGHSSPQGLAKLLADRYQCDCTVMEPTWGYITGEKTT